MEIQRCALDIAGSTAVVVDDRHPVAAVQQGLGLHHVRPVGVHHHQQGAGLGVDKGLVAADEHAVILRHGPQPAEERVGVVALQIDDDADLLAVFPGNAADAAGGAHHVHVRVLVAHDIDLAGVADQVVEGLGHDPALYLGPLLRALAAAAVELEVQAVLHHRLVPAPAQGHLNAFVGALVQLLKGFAVLADAEKRSGCALVDLGTDTTTVAVYKNNILRHLVVLPLGGNSITHDICDLDEAEHGIRREAMFAAVNTWFTKIGISVSVAFSGIMVMATGFTLEDGCNQSIDTILRMRLLYILLPAIGMFVGAALMWGYPLSESVLNKAKKELKCRHESATGEETK